MAAGRGRPVIIGLVGRLSFSAVGSGVGDISPGAMPMNKDTEKLPLSDYYELLDARTYLRTPKRWVALCALKSKFGKELKLYEWNWRGEEKGWKVALANLNVTSLNLKRIAADAEELAAKHDIPLKWKEEGGKQ